MVKIFIPEEDDFRRWIKEVLSECLGNRPLPTDLPGQHKEESLLCRKEAAGILSVSLVTLHDWMNKGMPFHKQGRRVYFLRAEIMEYIINKKGR